VGEAADHDVLRVAGDGGGGADIRSHRDGEEIGRRPPLQAQCQLQYERRQHQADRIIDQERGEQAGDKSDGGQQRDRSAYAAHHPRIGEIEEARKAEVGHHDHDPEKQCDRGEIHRPARLCERQDAGADHQTGPDQGDPRPIDPQAWDLADRERQIGAGEDRAGRQFDGVAVEHAAGPHQGRDSRQ
jgi:hypothetical protein